MNELTRLGRLARALRERVRAYGDLGASQELQGVLRDLRRLNRAGTRREVKDAGIPQLLRLVS